MNTLMMMQAFPVLQTARLDLRAVCGDDASSLYALYADARVMEFRGADVFQNLAQAESLIFSWRKQWAQGTGIRWAIVLRDTNQCIGTAGYKMLQEQHRRGEIGYDLHPDFWNNGFMTEALQAITSFGFSTLQLHTIEANIAPEHQASQRVLEKLNFRCEATFHENYFFERWWNSAIWTLRTNM